MRSRVIALIAVVSLLTGIVQLPLPAVAATAAATTAEHNHHHCCPKMEQTPLMAVTPAAPSLPCGANHSCCVVRAPAKLPSLPAGSNGNPDGRVAGAIEGSLPIQDKTSVKPELKSIPIRSPLDLSTVFRI